MVVDDAEAYAANQADDVQKLLTAANIKVDRESIPASTSRCDRELLGAREQGGRHQGGHRLLPDTGGVGLAAVRAAAEGRRVQG